MTQTSATQRGSEQADAIRPFNVNFPEAELTELRRRINATKWPERETVADASQGVQLATSQALARYWGTDYDWRKCEARLNALPNFITEIDGLDIHFIHSMACDGGGTRRRSTAGSRSRRAVMKASRSRSTARSISPTWNFTHASASSHASPRNPPTKDVRSPSFTARTTCRMTKACQGPAGAALVKASVSLSAMMYWTNAERPGPSSICLPSSASSVIDRSSSSVAAVACWRWQAHMNAWFTAARLSPFASRQARTPLTSPSAAKNRSDWGRRPLRWKRASSPFVREAMRPSHTDGATTAPASIRSSAHAARVNICSRDGSKLSP